MNTQKWQAQNSEKNFGPSAGKKAPFGKEL